MPCGAGAAEPGTDCANARELGAGGRSGDPRPAPRGHGAGEQSRAHLAPGLFRDGAGETRPWARAEAGLSAR